MKEFGDVLFLVLDGLFVLVSLFLIISGYGTMEHWVTLVCGSVCFVSWLIGLCRQESR